MNISNLQILIKMKLFLLNHSFWNLKLGIQDVGVHQNRSPLSTRWLHCCQRNGMLGNFQVYFQVHHSEESGSIVHKRSWGSLESARCCRSSIYKKQTMVKTIQKQKASFRWHHSIHIYTSGSWISPEQFTLQMQACSSRVMKSSDGGPSQLFMTTKLQPCMKLTSHEVMIACCYWVYIQNLWQ